MSARRLGPVLALAGLTLTVLLPFAGKPPHLDDPLFLWCARHVVDHPLDFYGFEVNWYGAPASMAEITKNPPGACYALAAIGWLLGWRVPVLHLLGLVSAVGAVLGTHALARRMGSSPRQALVAALATLLTPVFLVSATTLMCDVPMLCLWVAAILCWRRGLEEERTGLLALAALAAAACALTKYFGMALVPLLAVDTLVRRRPIARLAWLAIPVGTLVAYQLWTRSLYGRGLLLDAADYATSTRQAGGASLAEQGLIGLVFLGGCLASLVPILAWRLGARRSALLALPLPVALLALPSLGSLGTLPLAVDGRPAWGALIQAALFATLGVGLLASVAKDLLRRRDADALLLGLWILGTLVFAGFVNWTVNARSLLPLVPAVAIVVARTGGREEGAGRLAPVLLVVLAALIALPPALGDLRLATAAQELAQQSLEQTRGRSGKVVFQGHWGFQHAMQEGGAAPFDATAPGLASGDYVVIPRNNTNLVPLPPNRIGARQRIAVRGPRLATTMSGPLGAGFYSHLRGPLPYAYGRVPEEEAEIVRIR